MGLSAISPAQTAIKLNYFVSHDQKERVINVICVSRSIESLVRQQYNRMSLKRETQLRTLARTSTVSINSSSSPSVSCGNGLAVRLLVGLVSKLLVMCREALQTLCGDVSLDADE